MRHLVIVLLLCLSFTFFQNIFPQVNEFTRYYPLKEGNVWVFQFGSSWGQFYKIRNAVTSTLIFNGHKYFYINQYHYRVDSITANVFRYTPTGGCPWYTGERMFDSLAMKLNDTAMRNCGVNLSLCIDTNIRVKFGVSMRTKHFRYYNEGNAGSIYARDFGVISSYGGTSQNLWGMELLGCVIDGVVYGDTSMLTSVNQISSEVPADFQLSQNYPNPFNPITHFGFRIADFGLVRLTVFDMLGKEVQVLVNQQLSPGTYEVDFDGSNLPSGVYYYRLDASATLGDAYTETKKMVLIK